MDISVNKPTKDFLRGKFQEWYSNQVMDQLDGQGIETSDIQPIDLRMTVVKEVGALWLVEMAEYIAGNPKIIINGLIRSGITKALDKSEENTTEEELEEDSEDFDEDFV